MNNNTTKQVVPLDDTTALEWAAIALKCIIETYEVNAPHGFDVVRVGGYGYTMDEILDACDRAMSKLND